MNYVILVVTYLLLMTIAHGIFGFFQESNPTIIQRVVVSLTATIIATLISREFKKNKKKA